MELVTGARATSRPRIVCVGECMIELACAASEADLWRMAATGDNANPFGNFLRRADALIVQKQFGLLPDRHGELEVQLKAVLI